MTTNLDSEFAALARRLRAVTVRVIDEGGRGSGSGVVWSGDGRIVTNAHVVRGRTAEVRFENGASARGRVERRDDARDLAEIRIAPPVGLLAAQTRESRTLTVGELVAAVGNPLGLVGALSTGLVQRCNARWVIADVRLEPGNSGGPLADASGRVVGINSMVAGNRGFAVPSDVVAAFLGTTAAERLGIAVARGRARLDGRETAVLVVTAVEAGSVAERAGLGIGDAIVAAERTPIDAMDDIPARLAAARALEIVRGGRRTTLDLSGARAERNRAA